METRSETLRTSAQVFEECLEAGERWGEIRDLPEARRGDTYDTDRRQAGQRLIDLNAELDITRSVERYQLEAAAWQHAISNPEQRDVRGPLAAFATIPDSMEVRSAGEQFTESDTYTGAGNRARVNDVEVRNLLTGTSLGTSGSNLFVPVGSPSLAQGAIRRQRFFLRDVLAVQGTGLASVPYIREVSAGVNEGGASAVEEASAKPEVTMQFEQDDAPIRKIAAWIQATMEALDDAPTLRGYIDTRLAYMLQVREEQQVLDGGGSAPELKGILQFTSGNTQLQTQSLGGDLHAAVGSAIGKVENVDGDADAVVVNPLDYWAAVVARHSTWFDGSVSGGGGGSAPFDTPAPTMWGLPAIRSRALASGTSLVGAFRLGATLFDREATTIRTTDSHASLFVSNTAVILAEERVGLAVHRPDFFVKIS